MRRLYADREEKRVTRGSDISGEDGEQEQLDLNDPNAGHDQCLTHSTRNMQEPT
jgi:hypothetical protein